MSQSCRPHLFFCAHLILQNTDFHFFFLEIIFFFTFTTKNKESLLFWENLSTWELKKTCKIPFDFWKYGSWNFSVIFGFGCAWRQRPIEVKKKIKNRMPRRFEKFSQALRQSIFFFSLIGCKLLTHLLLIRYVQTKNPWFRHSTVPNGSELRYSTLVQFLCSDEWRHNLYNLIETSHAYFRRYYACGYLLCSIHIVLSCGRIFPVTFVGEMYILNL